MPTRTLSRPPPEQRALVQPRAGSGIARRTNHTLWVPLVLALATLLIRLPGIGRPLLGNFSTKAAVYGMIARNLARGEAHLLYPKLDILVGGEPSIHLVECPLSAYLTAAAWYCAGGSLDAWGRATSVVWCVLCVVLLYHLVGRRHGAVAGAGAAVTFALAPVSIVYGQAFQLQASVAALTVLALLSLQRWLDGGGRRWYGLLVLSGAALWSTKIYMLYLLPVLLTVIWEHGTRDASARSASRRTTAVAALALAIVPAILWYAHLYYAAQPTAEHPVYFSLQTTRAAHPIPHPLLKNPEFYKGLLDDLTGVVMTPVGFGLLLLGALGRLAWRYYVWLVAAAALVLLVPRKFHEMNYYWMAVLPLLCILAGLGMRTLWQGILSADGPDGAAVTTRRLGLVGACAVWLVLSLRYSVVPAFQTPAEDRGVVAAGQAVGRHSRPDARVVTVHGTNIDLLYYCDRKGWTLEVPHETPDNPAAAARPVGALDDFIRQGATHLVVANLEGLRGAARFQRRLGTFPLLERGEDYAVYRLAADEPVGARISRFATGSSGLSRR